MVSFDITVKFKQNKQRFSFTVVVYPAPLGSEVISIQGRPFGNGSN